MKNKLANHIKEYAAYYGVALFLLSNGIFFALSFEVGAGHFKAIFGAAQFFLFWYLAASLRPAALGSITSATVLFAYYFLVSYSAVVGAPLDMLLAARRWQEFVYLGRSYMWLVLLLLVTASLNALIFSRFKKASIRTSVILFVVVIASLRIADNELFAFVKQVANGNKGVDFYQERIYDPLVEESVRLKPLSAKPLDGQSIESNLKHIVMLQMESFNARLASPSTTPNFLKIASQGFYFPGFYSNSVQTILAQENILCSLPSSFAKDLVSDGRSIEVRCLPKLLKPLGYKSSFYASSRLEFEQTGKFMSEIGFDQVHGYDTMKPGDPQFMWGRQEGVFLERTFESMKRDGDESKSLAYITFEATNHWPFNNASATNSAELKFSDRLSGSMAKQDEYLGELISGLDSVYPEKDYVLFVFGDHSWPAAIQSDNYFNQRGALDENFLTSLAVFVGGRKVGRTIDSGSYSHMDTLPTIMELVGQPLPTTRFRRSYASVLEGQNPAEKGKSILLIQPYSDRFLVWMDQTDRYSFNLKQGKITKTAQDGTSPKAEQIVAGTLNDSINLFFNLVK
ncbi:sulfatase-like hydrolase/transferase [Candidatus Falkowbacteria bacterium]|nr:sulfatase-like hydrolase/transferase [Candidatus Falkowbacteria bacterium]